MSLRSRRVLLTVAAVMGIGLAVAVTWATSQIVSQRIGLSSEPVTAGLRLLPARHRPSGTSTLRPAAPPTPTPSAPARSTPVPTTPAPPVAVPEREAGEGPGGEGDRAGAGDD